MIRFFGGGRRFATPLHGISVAAALGVLAMAGGLCQGDPPREQAPLERAPFENGGFDFRRIPFGPPEDLADKFGIPSMDDFFGKLNPRERAALQQIPVSAREEQDVGRRAVQGHLAQLKAQGIDWTTRGRDHDYLRRLVDLIRPRMRNRRRYPRVQVYLADTEEIDARSFPGGTLIFTRGMLDFAGTEAALVGVVGHELSHLDHGHQLLHVRRLKLAQKTMAENGRGFRPEQFLAGGALMMKMFSRPFQPEDEVQADADGARWAYQAGYDPRALAELFRPAQPPAGQQLGVLDFFRSHPPDLERLAAVMRQFERLRRDEPRGDLYLGRENLKRRIARAQRAFPE